MLTRRDKPFRFFFSFTRPRRKTGASTPQTLDIYSPTPFYFERKIGTALKNKKVAFDVFECVRVHVFTRWWCGGFPKPNNIRRTKMSMYTSNDIRLMPPSHSVIQCSTWILYFILYRTCSIADDIVRMSLFTTDIHRRRHTHTQTHAHGVVTRALPPDHCHLDRSVYFFGYFWFLHHQRIYQFIVCVGVYDSFSCIHLGRFARQAPLHFRPCVCMCPCECGCLRVYLLDRRHFFALFLPATAFWLRRLLAPVHTAQQNRKNETAQNVRVSYFNDTESN